MLVDKMLPPTSLFYKPFSDFLSVRKVHFVYKYAVIREEPSYVIAYYKHFYLLCGRMSTKSCLENSSNDHEAAKQENNRKWTG